MLKILALRQRDNIEPRLFRELLSYTDEDRREKILKYHRWQDAQRSLLGEIMVRSVLCDKFRIKNRDIRLARSEMGRPYVCNIDRAFFNISHSGDWVVGAFADSPVGIDVEQIKEIDLSLAQSIMEANDYSEMLKQKAAGRDSFFYRCWTRNESFCKMKGRGLSLPLAGTQMLAEEAFFKIYPFDPGYVLSVCANSSKFPDSIILKDIPDLKSALIK